MKTHSLVLNPNQFKNLKRVSEEKGLTVAEYVNAFVSPVPCEVFIQKPIPLDPNERIFTRALDKSNGLEP
jgi:hypothetical protein